MVTSPMSLVIIPEKADDVRTRAHCAAGAQATTMMMIANI